MTIAAFDATAATGVDGSGTADLAAASVLNADGTAGNGTGVALDLDGLTNARMVLEQNENVEDDGENKWYACLDATAREGLLADESTIQTIDSNTVRALVNGQIDTFLGFKFLKSERLGTPSSSGTKLPFWVKKSMQVGMGQEAKAFMDVLPSKRHSTQVRYELDLGFTRMDEKGVVILEGL